MLALLLNYNMADAKRANGPGCSGKLKMLTTESGVLYEWSALILMEVCYQ